MKVDLRISYIVTENYKELKEGAFSGDVQSIVLLGPRGCGKTIATTTLSLSLIESSKTALYITPVIQNFGLENMMQYTRTLVELGMGGITNLLIRYGNIE